LHRAADAQRLSEGPLTKSSAAALEKLVDCYREAQLRFMKTPAFEASLQTELRSRLVLVGW